METIKIHGKDYVTVDTRVKEAHKDCKTISITTEVLPISDKIVIKATVTTMKGTFTGISAANPSKMIEKISPYEVAETSAVGRALGFAGYGVVNGIATADEIAKSQLQGSLGGSSESKASDKKEEKIDGKQVCPIHNTKMFHGVNDTYYHSAKLNELFKFDPKGAKYWCQGKGWHLSAKQ